MPRNLHPEDIKAMVRKTGVSIAELARRHRLSSSAGRKCLYRPIPAGNRMIADYLGQPLHKLWPEWFDAYGNRRSPKRTDPSKGAAPEHCQKRSAA